MGARKKTIVQSLQLQEKKRIYEDSSPEEMAHTDVETSYSEAMLY